MPNWCTNNIVIVGDKKQPQKIKAKLAGRDIAFECVGEDGGIAFDNETLFSFHNLIGVPVKVATAQYDPVGYEWCWKHWGTKWQAVEVALLTDSPSCLHYQFDTAWEPPLPIFKALFRAFPRVDITIDYDEEGMALTGRLTLRDGHVKHVKQVDDYWVGGCDE